MEDNFGVKERPGHENESISGSLSTTPKEETIDRSISAAESYAMSEKDESITLGSPNDGEVKTESHSNTFINDESTSPKKPTAEASQSVNDMNKLEVDEVSKQDKEKMQERKGEPQSARADEASKKPPSAPGAMNSWQSHNQKERRERGDYKHDTSFD